MKVNRSQFPDLPAPEKQHSLISSDSLTDRTKAKLFSGECKIRNYDPEQSASYRNKNIGFIFQDHLLLPYLTVKENILYAFTGFKVD